MNLTPEEREVGKENYYDAVGATLPVNRREFLVQSAFGAGAVSAAGMGAAYFQYKEVANPVRVAIIGSGDEGNVLIGALNPKYVQVVAICDIRPYNVYRSFHGDWSSDKAISVRPGLLAKYGWKSEDEGRKNVKVYQDMDECIKDPAVEAVITALPLHLHAEVTVKALQAGKHVLTEKLMGYNVAQCKLMGRVADKQKLILTVGHQRHYSVLYDNAVHLIKQGLIGQLHHIRAQWHRGNLPGKDSWQQPMPGGEVGFKKEKDGSVTPTRVDKINSDLASYKKKYSELVSKFETNAKSFSSTDKAEMELLAHKIPQWEAWASDSAVDAEKYGYQKFQLGGRDRSPLEELVRWRLFQRTGGGLMAELGSHQLDAASIFCSALRSDGKKAHPLTVHAVGGRHMFAEDRHAEDHVYCMFEFPGPNYDAKKVGYWDPAMNFPPKEGVPSYDDNKNHKIVVTYSSINGNGWGGYGEVVMGTKGTILLEREEDVLLYKDADTTTRVGVKSDGGGPTLDTQASGKSPAAVVKAVADAGPVSKGYQEEIEHWAYCIRNPDEASTLHCPARVALGDAVIALTTNVAMRNSDSGKGGFVQFKEEWFDINSDETPDGSSVQAEAKRLGANI
jgi:predicted dehydrogenase